MIGDRHQQVRYQSDFYRDYFYKILNALIFSCFIILILIAVIIYLLLSLLEPQYYATTMGGQIFPMTTISSA